MGWENRNGHRYYYRKRRIGGRVVSEYLGAGEWVEAIAGLTRLDRMERDEERAAWRTEREREQIRDADIDAVAGLLDTVTAGALLLAGCHMHKGTWRRKRTQ